MIERCRRQLGWGTIYCRITNEVLTMRLLLVSFLALYWGALPLMACADETAAGTASAMSADPCPPPLPMPEVMTRNLDRMLQPGKVDEDMQRVFGRPEVQDYLKTTQERARTDWPALCRYRAANKSLTSAVQVVFMGDSITEFWAQADHELFNRGIVGRGISGQTSPQMLLRFMQDVVALHPRLVHIMTGTNDLAGNTGPSAYLDFKNNVMAMVELAHAHKIGVVIASIPPAKACPWKTDLRPAADIVLLNKWLREYATESGSRYADYYASLVDEQGGFSGPLSNDGVHPNRDGYLKMRPLALKAIAP
jgi:lysophospholipase L1-like esterase